MVGLSQKPDLVATRRLRRAAAPTLIALRHWVEKRETVCATVSDPRSRICSKRPLEGEPPTVDLVMGYNKSNTSALLKRFLARVDDLVAGVRKAGPKSQSNRTAAKRSVVTGS